VIIIKNEPESNDDWIKEVTRRRLAMPRFLLEYLGSRSIVRDVSRLSGNEFYTLIMAAMRVADTDNLEKLSKAFPEVFQEFKDRYNLPGGRYPNEM